MRGRAVRSVETGRRARGEDRRSHLSAPKKRESKTGKMKMRQVLVISLGLACLGAIASVQPAFTASSTTNSRPSYLNPTAIHTNKPAKTNNSGVFPGANGSVVSNTGVISGGNGGAAASSHGSPGGLGTGVKKTSAK
jgi:hypothetical protein